MSNSKKIPVSTEGIKFNTSPSTPIKLKGPKIKDEVIYKPAHYNQNSMETIDVIENSVPRVHFCGYLRGNILKYMLRYEHKNGTEDLKKARWYLTRLIKTLT